MTKEAVMYNGRFCKSGLASRLSTFVASCFSINQVQLSGDATNSSRGSPQECKTNLNQVVLCKYFQTDIVTPKFSLPCDCGYNSKENGYCPLADQETLSNSSQLMVQVLNMSDKCHTLDRYNFVAHRDCGIPKYYPDELTLFEQNVEA
jgi:hypothetical protein